MDYTQNIEEKEGSVDDLVNYLLYNDNKIYLEISDKSQEDNLNSNDIFNFLTELFFKIIEKKYGIYTLYDLNKYDFEQNELDYILNKFNLINIKIIIEEKEEKDEDHNCFKFDTLYEYLSKIKLTEQNYINSDNNTNNNTDNNTDNNTEIKQKTLEDYKYIFYNSDKIHYLKFKYNI